MARRKVIKLLVPDHLRCEMPAVKTRQCRNQAQVIMSRPNGTTTKLCFTCAAGVKDTMAQAPQLFEERRFTLMHKFTPD